MAEKLDNKETVDFKELLMSEIIQSEAIINLLDKLGLSKVRGKKTMPQLVSKILCLHLKFYAGILVNPWTKEEVQGLHEPMITREELFKIQMVLSGKKFSVKHVRKNPLFPLRRIVFCGSCGRPLTGSVSRGNGGKYYYYHCYNKECPIYGKGFNKKDFEKAFIKYLNSITPKEEFLRSFNGTVLNFWKEKEMHFAKDVQNYQKQLAILEDKRKRIFEMREDGSYSPEEFKERKEEIENKIMAIKISLSETRIEQFDIEGTLSYANNFILTLGRLWFDLAKSQLRFQKMVFPDGISYSKKDGFRTTSLGLIYELNRTCGIEKSLVVGDRGLEPRTSSLSVTRSNQLS